MELVKYNNNSVYQCNYFGQLATGNMVLIKEQTASASSSYSIYRWNSKHCFG